MRHIPHLTPTASPRLDFGVQPELCQQAADVAAQDGVAVGMVSG